MSIGFGAYAVGVAFWIFIGAVAIAGIVTDYQKRRLNVDLLRTIIEKGQSLDPALVAKLISPDALDERTDPADLKLGGIITVRSRRSRGMDHAVGEQSRTYGEFIISPAGWGVSMLIGFLVLLRTGALRRR